MAQNHLHTATTVTVPADRILALAGESKTGYFSLETGELVEQLPMAGEF
jgi:DEAD/DEAH box helicase domain-containing protein